MHPAIIALLAGALVFGTFVASMAASSLRLSDWADYRHCLSAPMSAADLEKERRRQMGQGGLLLALTVALWASALALAVVLPMIHALIAMGVMASIANFPLGRAFNALWAAEQLRETDVSGYRQLREISDHRLVARYLAATRGAGRDWVTRVECERLRNLAALDELHEQRMLFDDG